MKQFAPDDAIADLEKFYDDIHVEEYDENWCMWSDNVPNLYKRKRDKVFSPEETE